MSYMNDDEPEEEIKKIDPLGENVEGGAIDVDEEDEVLGVEGYLIEEDIKDEKIPGEDDDEDNPWDSEFMSRDDIES